MLAEGYLLPFLKVKDGIIGIGGFNAVLVLLTAILLGILADYGYMLYMRTKLPPGPFPFPIVGNTFSLPDTKPWIYFEQLSKEYKVPLITFWIGRNPTIWICDAWCAYELLEKRAQLYSSRPRMVVFGELGTGPNNLVSMRTRTAEERNHWRIHRKLMHLGVGVQVVRRYRDAQNNESKVAALDILLDPAQYVKHLERYATSVVSIIAFGRRVARADDPIITEVIALMQLRAEQNVPGRSFPMLMETFPFLSQFPRGMPWMKGLGNRLQGGGHYFYYSLAEEAIQQRAAKSDSEKSGIPTPYVETIFKEAAKYSLPREELSNLTGNLFGAGSDTTSSTLITFVLACCAFPPAMKTAQAELDKVIGSARSPTWDDAPALPYLAAFVKELLRWRSVAILGGQPHSPTKDDFYNGYLIPAHSWVQGNLWTIHRHERDFPDPDRFLPERYLEGSQHNRPFPTERGHMAFGWGRRVCSGQALAEQGVWITVARLLWAFEFRGVDGEEVDVFAFTNGLNMRPQPFRCEIVARNEGVRGVVVREGVDALKDLGVLDGESRYRMSTFYQAQKKRSKEEPVLGVDGRVQMVGVK